MKDILSDIIQEKIKEIKQQQSVLSTEQLEESLDVTPIHRSMKEALRQSPTGIIAEFKRRSPSKGWINETADPQIIVPAYERAGAAACSILTDPSFFGGSLSDIRRARDLVDLPILRKDFIIDEYQLYQSKIIGADAILLIASALDKKNCAQLAQKAHELELEVLLELHDEKEIDYITPHVDMIGVNNRHLGSFHTDVDQSFRLVELLPKDAILVSESGLSEAETLIKLRQVGYHGFLMGEHFMRQADPGVALQQFIAQIKASDL